MKAQRGEIKADNPVYSKSIQSFTSCRYCVYQHDYQHNIKISKICLSVTKSFGQMNNFLRAFLSRLELDMSGFISRKLLPEILHLFNNFHYCLFSHASSTFSPLILCVLKWECEMRNNYLWDCVKSKSSDAIDVGEKYVECKKWMTNKLLALWQLSTTAPALFSLEWLMAINKDPKSQPHFLNCFYSAHFPVLYITHSIILFLTPKISFKGSHMNNSWGVI